MQRESPQQLTGAIGHTLSYINARTVFESRRPKDAQSKLRHEACPLFKVLAQFLLEKNGPVSAYFRSIGRVSCTMIMI